MIRMNDKFLGPKVVLPHLQCPHQCVKLFVIYRVVQGCLIDLFAEISNETFIMY